MTQCDECDDEADYSIEEHDFGPRKDLCTKHAVEFVGQS